MQRPAVWMAGLGAAVLPATLAVLNGPHTFGSWTAVVLNGVLGVAAVVAGIVAIVKARRWTNRVGIAVALLLFAAIDFLLYSLALSVATGSLQG